MSIITIVVNGAGSITRDGVFIYPQGREMTSKDLRGFIDAFQGGIQHELHRKMAWYLGKHDILRGKPHNDGMPDNRIVMNLCFSNVDTFNGFFIGKTPQISLEGDAANESLQIWLDANSFQDRLAEISKQVDIYGKAYALVYQNEQAETRFTYADAETSFMVYDDTVEQNPVAFVTFTYDETSRAIEGTLYQAGGIQRFGDNGRFEDGAEPNVSNLVSAVEFISNDERQGLNDQIFTLNDALDRAASQKANQVEYFDNAYLKVLGVKLPENENGEPSVNIKGNQLIYSPNTAATDADVSFISKPDGDQMQENLINRLIEQIYNVTGVVNFNDQKFSGNLSGKALERLLQRMSNRAAFKRTKFTEALRELFRIVFSYKTIKGVAPDDWQNLTFKFFENLPADYSDEASAAKSVDGIVSRETQLKLLSFVDDPKKEIQRMQDEAADNIKKNQEALGSQTDQDKAASDEEQAPEDGD